MKIISIFNNKGGVGKTTLTYHLAHALSESGFKVLLIDADPQCNLTIYSIPVEVIHGIWEEEDAVISGGLSAYEKSIGKAKLNRLLTKPRSLHLLLMPTIEGVGEFNKLPPPINIATRLDLIPGRLSLHAYEEKISSRWSDAYRGDSLAIRTITRIRAIAEEYSEIHNYDFVIVDTSPSLGGMNKCIISTVDGFFVPAMPDMFSLYGIRNIGSSLEKWHEEFNIIYKLISNDKRKQFPKSFVQFLGYTIYNAKKYTKTGAKWNLAQAHLRYAEEIPEIINKYIGKDLRGKIQDKILAEPIGGEDIMHTHNTFPALAQHYRVPMWKIPSLSKIDKEHQNTINGQKQELLATKNKYTKFSKALIDRVKKMG
ncbi:MAG: AAA family ATPase [Betaproteobacteria bacterium]|nr:AAA family ATPase [Betaproteobacteria bacterium]